LLNAKHTELFVETKPREWGDLIKQRATPWAKRIQLLYRVKQLIKIFKKEKKKFMIHYLSLPDIEKSGFDGVKSSFGN
jgi:hypothetical protein